MCITTITLPICGHDPHKQTLSNDLFPTHPTGPGTHISQCEASRCHRVCRGDTRTVHSTELCSACENKLQAHLHGGQGGGGGGHGGWSVGGNSGRMAQGRNAGMGSWHPGAPPQQERLQMVGYPQPGASENEYEPLMFGRSSHSNTGSASHNFNVSAMPPANVTNVAPMPQQPSSRTWNGGRGGLFSTDQSYQPSHLQFPSAQPRPQQQPQLAFHHPQMAHQPQQHHLQPQHYQAQPHLQPLPPLPQPQYQQPLQPSSTSSADLPFAFRFDSDLDMDFGDGYDVNAFTSNPFSAGAVSQGQQGMPFQVPSQQQMPSSSGTWTSSVGGAGDKGTGGAGAGDLGGSGGPGGEGSKTWAQFNHFAKPW